MKKYFLTLLFLMFSLSLVVGENATTFYNSGLNTEGDFTILGFSILFIILFSCFLLVLINTIVKFGSLEFSLYDLAYSYSLFFGLLAFKFVSYIYITQQEFNNYIDLSLKWLAIPLLVLPVVAWLFTLINDFKDNKTRSLEW